MDFGAPVRTVQGMESAPTPCKVCALPDHVRTEIDKMPRRRAVTWSKEQGHPVSDRQYIKHRAHQSLGVVHELQPMPEPVKRASMELGPDGGEISTGAMTGPVVWAEVFEAFGLDPELYEIVDDTVRMSVWEAQTKQGIQQLRSYRARFRVRTTQPVTDLDLDRLRSIAFRSGTPVKVTAEGTLVVALADLQLGKSEGGGVEATVRRFRASLDRIVAHAHSLVEAGTVGRICLAQMGDPVEGCSGNYASQTFTVQLNQRQQLNLALDLLTTAIAELAEVAPVDFVTVHSNHGEWTRIGGSKPITGDSDTADGFLGDTLARVFAGNEHVTFHTPHDESVMTLTVSGVPIAFSHGHKAAGGMEKWLAGQTQRLVYKAGVAPRVWVTAHFHHLRCQDLGAYTWFQCPSLDGGSKWFEDSAGKWSTPGVLTFVATAASPVGWHTPQML